MDEIIEGLTGTLNQMLEHLIDNLDEDSDFNQEIDLTLGYYSTSGTTKEQFLNAKSKFQGVIIDKLNRV